MLQHLTLGGSEPFHHILSPSLTPGGMRMQTISIDDLGLMQTESTCDDFGISGGLLASEEFEEDVSSLSKSVFNNYFVL
jgi:hypothetical protein